jgi:hypothetical protein
MRYQENGGGKRPVMVPGVGMVYRTQGLSFRPVAYDDQDAVAHWMRHYEASLHLDEDMKITKKSTTRAALRNEMRICQRKMEHWQKHKNWDTQEITRLTMAAKTTYRLPVLRAAWKTSREGG